MIIFKKRPISEAKILWCLNFWIFWIRKNFLSIKLDKLFLPQQNNQFIDYYCKISRDILGLPKSQLKDVKLISGGAYSYDFYRTIADFPKHLKFNYFWGDLTEIPSSPTFVKSRPINGDNQNSILLPLDSRRHLRFIDDSTPYRQKKSMAVWRGAVYQQHRIDFVKAAQKLPFCDIADTSRTSLKESPKNFLSIQEQLEYKIIFSIEGNDVATNLKWIMGSNSLCFTLPLVYETWYREGLLTPGVHYVEIKPDFSDIQEKFNFYINHPEAAEKIISAANAYAEEFKNIDAQYELARSVVYKYFHLSNQI
jgi:hypothetical protein